MEPTVEYFYGDTLRWSFGFDNPNKTAVLFACALPFLWWAWEAVWKLKSLYLRIPGLLLTAAAFLTAGYCLCMTFSRGGLLAACAGLAYLILPVLWREKARPRPIIKWVCHGFLLLTFAACVLWTGLGARTGEATAGDRSVSNRFQVWEAALQMSVENPQGFGTGNSGMEYMQWYQATDATEGYRTMVNSYLTFLVEQGWLKSLGIAVLFTAFWIWTRPQGRGGTFALGLRGVILAFLVGGFFSTIMEEPKLLIFPGIATAILLAMALIGRRKIQRKPALAYAGAVTAALAVVFAIGWKISADDPLRREFGPIAKSRSVVLLRPRSGNPKPLGLIPDEKVLGEIYGKLLREMALGAKVSLILGERSHSQEVLMVIGGGVHKIDPKKPEQLILLAPEQLTFSRVADFSDTAGKLNLILPEIDEDGRSGFWEETQPMAAEEALVLYGIGTRADWAWAEIVEYMKVL